MTRDLSKAIRAAAKREGLDIESFRRKHGLSNTHFYRLAGGRDPIPPKVRDPLLRLVAAGVRHPLLRLIAA